MRGFDASGEQRDAILMPWTVLAGSAYSNARDMQNWGCHVLILWDCMKTAVGTFDALLVNKDAPGDAWSIMPAAAISDGNPSYIQASALTKTRQYKEIDTTKCLRYVGLLIGVSIGGFGLCMSQIFGPPRDDLNTKPENQYVD